MQTNTVPRQGRIRECLGLKLGPRHRINRVTVQYLLSNRVLYTARETSPSTSGKHRVGDPLSLRSKPNNLFEHSLAFFVHSATRLEHNGSEIVVRMNKGRSVTFRLPMKSIRFAWFGSVEVRGSDGTNNSYVDGQTTAKGPVFDGDITGSSTGAVGFAQKA